MRTLRPSDPRKFQIVSLSMLVVWGFLALHFDISPARIVASFAGALGAQALGSRHAGIRFEPRSALISALSILLLLRAESAVTLMLAAAAATGSKFLIRFDGRHVFNPTNIAIVAVLVVGIDGWVSSGQWGSGTWVVFLLACAGSLVVHRAERSDVTWAFLASWSAILFGRALYLGDPLAIPIHQIQNGTLLIFSFFMISDPKTTPDSRKARILWAMGIAAIAGVLRFQFQQPNALLFALVVSSPAVPLLNRLLRGYRFEWPDKRIPVPAGPFFPKGVTSWFATSSSFSQQSVSAIPSSPSAVSTSARPARISTTTRRRRSSSVTETARSSRWPMTMRETSTNSRS